MPNYVAVDFQSWNKCFRLSGLLNHSQCHLDISKIKCWVHNSSVQSVLSSPLFLKMQNQTTFHLSPFISTLESSKKHQTSTTSNQPTSFQPFMTTFQTNKWLRHLWKKPSQISIFPNQRWIFPSKFQASTLITFRVSDRLGPVGDLSTNARSGKWKSLGTSPPSSGKSSGKIPLGFAFFFEKKKFQFFFPCFDGFLVFWKHCLGDMNVTCQLNIFLTVQLVSVQRFVQPDTSGPRIFMSRKDEKEHPEHPSLQILNIS